MDALREVNRPAERALGALPVLLGAHLLVEAVVWQGVTGDVAPSTGRQAMWVYLAIAVVVVPALVPFATRAVEPDPGRRRTMAWLGAGGALLAGAYLAALVHGPVSVRIAQNPSPTTSVSNTVGSWAASTPSSPVPRPCSPLTAGSPSSAWPTRPRWWPWPGSRARP